MARAKTGTGKTMGFLIPAIEALVRAPPRAGDGISVLVRVACVGGGAEGGGSPDANNALIQPAPRTHARTQTHPPTHPPHTHRCSPPPASWPPRSPRRPIRCWPSTPSSPKWSTAAPTSTGGGGRVGRWARGLGCGGGSRSANSRPPTLARSPLCTPARNSLLQRAQAPLPAALRRAGRHPRPPDRPPREQRARPPGAWVRVGVHCRVHVCAAVGGRACVHAPADVRRRVSAAPRPPPPHPTPPTYPPTHPPPSSLPPPFPAGAHPHPHPG